MTILYVPASSHATSYIVDRRYLLLLHLGGVYIDIDVESLQVGSLERLLPCAAMPTAGHVHDGIHPPDTALVVVEQHMGEKEATSIAARQGKLRSRSELYPHRIANWPEHPPSRVVHCFFFVLFALLTCQPSR